MIGYTVVLGGRCELAVEWRWRSEQWQLDLELTALGSGVPVSGARLEQLSPFPHAWAADADGLISLVLPKDAQLLQLVLPHRGEGTEPELQLHWVVIAQPGDERGALVVEVAGTVHYGVWPVCGLREAFDGEFQHLCRVADSWSSRSVEVERGQSIRGKQFVKQLRRLGWQLARISGSHHIMKLEDKTVSVPVHGNRELAIGTLRALLKQVGVGFEDLCSA